METLKTGGRYPEMEGPSTSGQHFRLPDEVAGHTADPREGVLSTVENLGLEFPVIYSLDAARTSKLIGCYTGTHEGTPHVQPASFVLDSDGTLVHAVYSSGEVGRLTAEDALTLARGLRKKRGNAPG